MLNIALLLEEIKAHETLLWWMGGISVLVFLASMAALPIVLARLPEDYFIRPARQRQPLSNKGLPLRLLVMAGKNILGALLILAGIAMLILPGQGLLTIFVGILLLNFPGKYRMERWLISRPPILGAINWIRQRRHKPPLRIHRLSGKGRHRN